MLAQPRGQLLGMDVEHVVERKILHLSRQRLVDARPARRAFGVEPLDGRVDPPARRYLGQPAELLQRQDDGNVAPLAPHAHGLRHVDKPAETVLGVGGSDDFDRKILAELANLSK